MSKNKIFNLFTRGEAMSYIRRTLGTISQRNIMNINRHTMIIYLHDSKQIFIKVIRQ